MENSIRIGYVHGYLGSSNGESYKRLEKYIPEGYELVPLDYDDRNAELSMNSLINLVQEHDINFLIGSSLGGFLVLNMWGFPRIVINPCYHPSVELPKLGASEEFANSFKMFEDDLKKYNDHEERENVTAIFGNKDELLGLKYVEEYKKDFKYLHIVDSEHRISEEGAKFIMEHVLDEKMEQMAAYSEFAKYWIEF